MGFCLVFTPGDPNLYTLNARSWLILELCEGATFARLDRAYWKEATDAWEEDLQGCSHFAAPPRPERRGVRDALLEGLADLEARRIIEFVAAA